VTQAVDELAMRNLVTIHGERLVLTDSGRERLSA
jgi:Mn-dependent DtxR family transcriptional regulator